MDYLVCIKARSLQCLARDPCTRAHRARTFDCEVSAHARARAHMGHAWRCSCWCFEGRCARCCMKISASCATGLMLAALWGAQGPSSGAGLLRRSGQPGSAAAESALPQGHLDSSGYLMMPLGFTVGDLMDSLWRVCCCGLYPGGVTESAACLAWATLGPTGTGRRASLGPAYTMGGRIGLLNAMAHSFPNAAASAAQRHPLAAGSLNPRTISGREPHLSGMTNPAHFVS
jgi:hypothetical protein